MNAASRGVPSLADQAYRRMEHMLVTLELPPGEAVQEKALAETVGLGRTPVREAVQRLAGDGLIDVLPRKGLVVAPILRSDLTRIVEARRVMERLLVVKAAERASPDQRRALLALSSHLQGVGEDLEAFFRLDRRLDELLAAAGGNPWLVRALAPMHIHCRRFWYLQRDALDVAEARDLHAGLARAVSENDSAGGVRALNGIIAVLERRIASQDDIS